MIKQRCGVFTLLISIAGAVSAQDLIVTDKGDSLNCRITSVRKDYIHFVFKYNDEFRSTLLPVNKVQYHQKGYFSHAVVPASASPRYQGDYQRFRMALHGGWSHLTGKTAQGIPSGFSSYYKGLKSGFHIGGDAGYFFTEYIGAGLKYQYFHTSNRLDNITATDQNTGETKTGSLADNVSTHFIAPAMYTRFNTRNKKVVFLANAAIGYLSYRNNATLINSFILKGGTLGVGFDLGADFMLSRHLALGAGVSAVAGSLSKVTKEDGAGSQTITLKDGERENLSRIDVSAGLRWYW